MKDSGIPWIGKIPSHWETCFIKQIMQNKSVKGFPYEEVLSLYREYGVVPKDSRDDNHNVTSEDTSGYKLVDIGDFVINKMKAWQGSMAVSGYKGIISPAYYICRFTAPVCKRYIHYLLRNETYKEEYKRLSTGLRVGQWDLNVDDFLHIPMVLPPVAEQQSIADFLDKKCSEIDEMIMLQARIIEELKAFKQAIIFEVVCRGLNHNTPMKDSGIEWIGTIPFSSEVIKLKFISTISRGLFNHRPRDDERYYGGDYPFIQTGDVTQSGKYITKYSQTLSELGRTVSKLFPRGTMTMTIAANVGDVAILGFDAYFPDSVLGIIPQERVWKDYLYYAIVASKTALVYAATINTQMNLNVQSVGNVLVPLHPLEEQRAIADYLDKKCDDIDTLISVKQSKIDALKEYKKSIIYEYITGKKEISYGD